MACGCEAVFYSERRVRQPCLESPAFDFDASALNLFSDD